MASILNLIIHFMAYDESEGITDNPSRRIAHYTRDFRNKSILNPLSNKETIEPGGSLTVFSGVRSTSIDGTTEFDVSLLTGSTSLYRFQHSSGTAPVFRTERLLSGAADSEVTVTVNNNATAKFEATGGTVLDFSGAQVGDLLRIVGVGTGDPAGPFNPLNTGLWSVIAKTATSATCVRPLGASFQGVAESSIVLGASFATNFRVYSTAGVQVGDNVDLSAGFSSVTQGNYLVSAVGPDFFEISSSSPLPLESAIAPGIPGMSFYSAGKKIVYLEADQNAIVKLNGDSSNSTRMSPFLAGDPEEVAVFIKIGLAYSLEIENVSDKDPLNLYWFMAE